MDIHLFISIIKARHKIRSRHGLIRRTVECGNRSVASCLCGIWPGTRPPRPLVRPVLPLPPPPTSYFSLPIPNLRAQCTSYSEDRKVQTMATIFISVGLSFGFLSLFLSPLISVTQFYFSIGNGFPPYLDTSKAKKFIFDLLFCIFSLMKNRENQ